MIRISAALAVGAALLTAAPAPAAPAALDLSVSSRSAALGEGGAEISAYDARSRRAFVTNAVQAAVPTEAGSVQLFTTSGDHLGGAAAGALPDMLTFTPDGRSLLVANEGEPAAGVVDPEGSVTIFDVRGARLRTRTATFAGVPTAGPVRSFTRSLAHSDTGSGLEHLTAELDAANFNKDNETGAAADGRSDDKGPEPEGVDVGRVGRRTDVFAGAERTGAIVAYDLSERPGAAAFAGYLNPREADLGPEGIEFVPGRESPTRRPFVLVTNEVSGTLAVIGVARC